MYQLYRNQFNAMLPVNVIYCVSFSMHNASTSVAFNRSLAKAFISLFVFVSGLIVFIDHRLSRVFLSCELRVTKGLNFFENLINSHAVVILIG